MPKNKGWFRLYDRMIDSPQILEINDSEFRLIVSLWCLSSAEGCNGKLSYTNSALRRRILPDHSLDEITSMITHLIELDLLFGTENNYMIPRWELHQYEYNSRIPKNRSDIKKADTPIKPNGKQTENKRKENGQIDTETDTEREADINNICTPDGGIHSKAPVEISLFLKNGEGAQEEAKADPGKGFEYPTEFESFWQVYPRKKEKQAAFACWKTRQKEGHNPSDMVLAAQHYSVECRKQATEESFIKQAKTFLGPKKPFLDYINPGKVVDLNGTASGSRAYRG